MQINTVIVRNMSTILRKASSSSQSVYLQTCSRNLHSCALRFGSLPSSGFRVSHVSTKLSTTALRRLQTQLLKTNPASYLLLVRNESTSAETPSDLLQPAQTVNMVNGTTQTQQTEVITTAPIESSETLLSVASHSVPEVGVLDLDSIPEPPIIPSTLEELASTVTTLGGEPTMESLGLGGWTPAGIVQQCLEYFHINLGMPWWASILTGVVIVRLLLFPLVIKSQRNAAKMNNNLPQLQVIQMKMTEARQTGNALLAAKYANDLMVFMKEKEISPFKSMLVPLAMAPVFISCFFGLRKMANLPVDSMKTGGMMWFTDLTVADPYFILPLITSVTLWITLEVGVDGAKMGTTQNSQLMKYVMRGMPIVLFPFTMNFPAAILCYWVSTNAVSLIQVSIMKLPAVRQKLNIEPIRAFVAEDLPLKKKGFVETFKDSWTNSKITREMEDRERHDEVSFKRAGKGPIPKTYKYDPTKVQKQSVLQAKSK